MANPFLFTEEEMAEEVATTQETVVNPFLMDDVGGGDDANLPVSDNPFFDQVVSNPFADFQQPEPEDQQPINTSFFDTTIHDPDEMSVPPVQISVPGEFYSSEDELERNGKKAAPPPRPGPPIAAQHLISTVAGQLDLASHDLLGRIPVTRTPSPVSMRDLHSPSPTPDDQNLLDCNLEEQLPLDDAPEQQVEVMETTRAVPEAQKAPPPARPPPRPQPPPKPQPPAVVAQVVPEQKPIPQEADIMDMFGVEEAPVPTRPPPPKTNEDIMSLFSAPAATEPEPEEPHQTDLMSEEIPAFNPIPSVVEEEVKVVAVEEPAPVEVEVEMPVEEPQQQPMEIQPEVVPQMETVPVMHEIPKNSPFACEPDDDIYEPQVEQQPEMIFAAPAQPPVVQEIVQEKVISPENNPFATTVSVAPVPPRPAPPPRPAVPPPVAVAPVTVPTPAPPRPVEAPVFQAAPTNIFASVEPVVVQPQAPPQQIPSAFAAEDDDEFDAFSAKFNSAQKVEKTNIFLEDPAADAWGDDTASGFGNSQTGFDGEEDGFDAFYAMSAPPPSAIVNPPSNITAIDGGDAARSNPFDNRPEHLTFEPTIPESTSAGGEGSGTPQSPQTPLFDDDVSQPLEDFPRIAITGAQGWEMQLRQPNKKKITGQRFWKKIHVRLVYQGDNPVIQLLNTPTDKEPFQELPLQASYSVSEISAQQYDQFGKIFTVKLQYIFYKERTGIRPGQVTKAERITNKLSQFAAYAIQGDYQGVKEFGSDLKKLGLPVEHAPQVSELFKIGSMNYEDLKQFSVSVEEALFKMQVHRDRAMTYKMEEVQVTAVDEIYVEQDHEGRVLKQIARVRLFLLGFLTGMPTIELGVNDMLRQGKEVVGRHDIIPVATEEWIRLEGVEFHGCVQLDHYEHSRTIKFQPPDAQYLELMRFRVRPPKNRELPLQVKATWCVNGNRVELRVDVLVPGFASRKLGQIPCEDVAIRFPIPECWIYLFRVEKHFRYGSKKSAHRRTGKIKGIERILGTVDTLQESLIEVTSGQAKYEHHHRAIVWRCPRLPKDGQGAYTTHQMVCRMALTSYDQIPEQLAPYCFVEFTMPATQVSHMTVRSVSIQDSDSDDPPEKYVRYLARHEYRVGIEHTTGETVNSYLAATSVAKKPIKEEAEPAPTQPAVAPPSDSDSDSN